MALVTDVRACCRQNKRQGLGFVMAGIVFDMDTLKALGVKIVAVASTAATYVLAMADDSAQGALPAIVANGDIDACALQRAAIELCFLNYRSDQANVTNATCNYNVIVEPTRTIWS
eukprot:SAG31_NODE_5902_length_2264_cov_2.222633_3_plen_116_part_00